MFFAKIISLLFYSATFSGIVWSQEQQLPKLSNECSVSANHPIVSNGSTSGKFLPGFGFAATLVGNSWVVMDRTLSFEFNYVRQKASFTDFMGKASSDNFEVDEVAIYSISVPATLRFGLFKDKRLFLEPGIFFDFTLYGSVSGTLLKQEGESVRQTKRTLLAPFNGGPSAAIGWKFPFEKEALIVRSEARFGLANVYSDVGNSSNPHILNWYCRFSIGWQF